MHRFRLLVSVMLAVVAVGTGALAVFPPKEFIKGRLAGEVKAATGRALAIKGATSVRLLPSFVLRVEKVELENPPGTSGAPLFSAHAVLIEGSLWTVLNGSNRFERVSVEGPRVALEMDAKGQPNWAMPPGGGPFVSVRSITFAGGEVTYRDGASNGLLRLRGADGTIREYAGASIGQIEIDAGEATVVAGPGGPQLTLATVDVEATSIAAGGADEVIFKAASVVYRKGPGAQPVKLDQLQITAQRVSPAKAFPAAATAMWNGEQAAGDIQVPPLAELHEGKASSPMRVRLALPKGTHDAEGELPVAGGAPALDGKAGAAAASLREFAAWAGVELQVTVHGWSRP
jgi:uncharacterized protein involved in outer membrane biogenesis